jgi:hypothetical protein
VQGARKGEGAARAAAAPPADDKAPSAAAGARDHGEARLAAYLASL